MSTHCGKCFGVGHKEESCNVKPEPDENVFHAHLDVCERCRNQPFNLCPIGVVKIQEAVNNIKLPHVPGGPRR